MDTVFLGDNTREDLDIAGLIGTFPLTTNAGKAALEKRLSEPIADKEELTKRQEQIRKIRILCKENPEIARALATLKETEEDVLSVASAATDSRHAEYYSQILWATDSRFAWLNQYGWITELIVFFRTLLLPGLAILMPILIFLAPIFVYKYVIKKPITFSDYFTMLQTSLKKAMPSVLGKPRFTGTGGIAETGEQFLHIGVSLAMFIASIWNQVSAAMSMRKVVADMGRRANAVRRFTEATGRLAQILGVSFELPSWPLGEMGLFGDAWNHSAKIQSLVSNAGELDMLVAIATQKRICYPEYSDRIAITNIYHPGLGEKRVYNTVDSVCNHILLTGPNRGGKSTLLKSIGAAALMSQTLGIVFAKEATMPLFSSIITALNPTDTLGKMSLFEAEIEFAKSVKDRLNTHDGPMLLIMDEIFHGTNAHDGVEASKVFLDDIYSVDAPIFSVVSTHYMELPETYGGEKAANLCMDASVDPNDPDRLVYTYRLKEGINQYSSVREILRERGLLVQKTPVPASKA